MKTTDLSLREGLALAEHLDARDGVVRTQYRVRVASHWSAWSMPCLTCGALTHSRDGHGLPVDPDCAATVLARQTVEQTPEWRYTR